MQNATKKLIASLGVVLMGIGLAGAANAATRNIMVLTKKGDGSFKVYTDLKEVSKGGGPCREVKAPGWMNGQLSGTVGTYASVEFSSDKKCTKFSRGIALRKITSQNKINYWIK